MMAFLGYFVGVVGIVLWILAIAWLSIQALDHRSAVLGVSAVGVFAVGMAAMLAAISYSQGDHDPRLCARGHQEWVTTRTPPAVVGRIIVSGHESTDKRWVCEVWEGER